MARKYIEQTIQKDIKVNPYTVASVTPSFLKFTEAYGICGDQYIRPLNLSKFPFKVPLGWASKIVAMKNLRAPFAFTFYPITGDKLTAQINRTINQAMPQPGDGMLTFTERSAKEFQAENAAQINEMLLSENARLFEMTCYLVLRAEGRNGKDHSQNNLIALKDFVDDLVFKATRAHVEKQFSNTESAFWAASPCFTNDETARLSYGVPVPSETIGMAELFTSFGFDDKEGVILGSDNHGAIVRLNLREHTSERPNSNVLLIAESGNGKSTLIKHISLYEYLLWDTRVLVINDPESEYAAEAIKLGGEVSNPIGRLSPFEPRNITSSSMVDSDDDEEGSYIRKALNERVLSNHIPFLRTFLQMAFPLIDEKTATWLDDPITKCYEKYGITAQTTFDEYYAGPQQFPILEDLYWQLAKDAVEAKKANKEEDANRLYTCAQAIKSSAIGYDKADWQSRETFNPKAKFLVIDTSTLSADKNLKSAQLYNILMWAWSQIRSNRFGSSYTRVIMDELQSVVNPENPKATAQIADMVRRIRKYNGGVMFGLQNINALLNEKMRTDGTLLLDSCVYKFFGAATGKAPGSSLWQTQQYLSLTDKAREELGKATRGHFITTIGKRDKTWLYADAIEDWELDLFGKGGGR